MTMQQFFDAFMVTVEDGQISLFEGILQYVYLIVDTIVETPLLLFTTGFLFIGGCIGIFGRLLSRN